MGSSQSSSAKVGLSIEFRTSAGSSAQRSGLSFKPPWLAVETLSTPSASSTISWGGPQGVCSVVLVIKCLLFSLSCSGEGSRS